MAIACRGSPAAPEACSITGRNSAATKKRGAARAVLEHGFACIARIRRFRLRDSIRKFSQLKIAYGNGRGSEAARSLSCLICPRLVAPEPRRLPGPIAGTLAPRKSLQGKLMRLRSSAARLAAVSTATGIAVLLAAGFGFQVLAQGPQRP